MMSTSGKLNKSYSESELNRLIFEFRVPDNQNSLLIDEEVCHNAPVLMKSGHSIPSQLHDIENTYSSSLTFNKFVGTNVELNTEEYKNHSISSYYDNYCEIVPMDIDLSDDNRKVEECLSLIENMDIDMNCHDSVTRKDRFNTLETMLKKRKSEKPSIILSEEQTIRNNLSNPILHKRNGLLPNSIIVLIIIFLLVFLYIYIFQDEVIFVNNDIQLQNLEKDLIENVYEQKDSIKIVIRSLQQRSHWANKIKVLSFIGSSGVGKTFVANILKKHFYRGLVHELYGIQLNHRSQWENILNRLKSCCLNLIIIDDLNKEDTTELFAFVHSLPKNHYILVISIFSIQHSDDKLNYVINYDDINVIRYDFNNSGLFHELVVFHQFDNVQIQDWLDKKLKIENVQSSEILLNSLLYNHNASFEGLKGLYSKLLLELEKLR